MHQLVGRLTALDPEASESLKVIAYFDALVDGHANTEVLLRGAAVLSGCAAGFAAAGTQRRVDATGIRSPVDATASPPLWPRHPLGDGGYAWLERVGPAHANDEMILERLVIALSITFERSAPVVAARRAVETVVDFAAPRADRLTAATQLKLDMTADYCVSAMPALSSAPGGHQTVMVTRVGAVRAVIRPARHGTTNASVADPVAEPVDGPVAEPVAVPFVERVGVGFAVPPGELDRSWSSALLALRMTSEREPVVQADDLGAVLMLAEAADERDGDHPDVLALKRLIGSPGAARDLVEAMVATGSARAAARELGMHHSTVQARVADYSQALGFDVRTMSGQTRLELALRLYYLSTNVFG
ncbi:helix-turn-helix domain-containing protein [Subtercola endophyticus]|uniref:helix-turn-helix domain-containing protein n=1 Tax=Subtercola endophyticus TaxID=2895559 RepID=UPI001E404490|nr:helix-turn-helix domain-containing protein [Subtercola endophyticus]UFS59578.1 helix-turn-helix domain-containing protein [Subtercola endophyticus]